MNGKEFGEWLDKFGIDVATAAAHFGVSEGSIYKWRSTPGVPDRKVDWVRGQMAAYEMREHQSPALNRVVIEVTNDQFDAWNAAANSEGKLLKQWAIDVLEEAAEAEDPTGSGVPPNPLSSLPYPSPEGRSLRVAEPEQD